MLKFNQKFEFEYGVAANLSAKVRRIVANNPGAFTFHGTGTFLIGRDKVAVIDPGPALPAHVDAIMRAVRGERITHIFVTHTHVDHSAAARMLQHACDAPIFAFGRAETYPNDIAARGADLNFAPDVCIQDAESVAGDGWRLQAVHTPGHCANHLCFALLEEQALFCGDQLMAWSTPVIMPPDGNVGDYVASLEKLIARDERIYFPAHGAAIDSPKSFAREVIKHRLARVEQTAAAVNDGLARVPMMRRRMYPDLPAALEFAADMSVLASLRYLLERGRIKTSGVADLDAEYVCA